MRRVLTFACEGETLHATVDDASGATGLLIVSGGHEIRVGAHRGMAKLAAEVAASGHPVLRFDRRGIGDSEGANAGFESSGPDITAALWAFRTECPALTRIVAFGNCDAASALMLHCLKDIAHAVIANPWVVEADAGVPAPAAVKAHYLQRLKEPRKLIGIFTGAVDLKKLVRGLGVLARTAPPSTLAQRVADGMTAFGGAVTILLAKRDGTACAFAAEWRKAPFADARGRADVAVIELDSASHSFAGDADYAVLKSAILSALAQ